METSDADVRPRSEAILVTGIQAEVLRSASLVVITRVLSSASRSSIWADPGIGAKLSPTPMMAARGATKVSARAGRVANQKREAGETDRDRGEGGRHAKQVSR